MAFRQPVEHTGHHDRAGPGTAGQRLAGAPLPDPHLHVGGVDHLHKLDIGLSGKDGVAFQHRAVRGHGGSIGVVHKGDGMRIAHADKGAGVFMAVGGQHMADDGFSVRRCRDLPAVQFRQAHIHPHADRLAVFHIQVQSLHPRARFDGQVGLVRQSAVVAILGHAADTVAAHLAFAAVIIEHLHPKIRLVAGQDQDQSVGAAAEMRAAHPHAQRRRVGNGFLQTVDINVVVSDAFHFGKAHTIPPLSWLV